MVVAIVVVFSVVVDGAKIMLILINQYHFQDSSYLENRKNYHKGKYFGQSAPGGMYST